MSGDRLLVKKPELLARGYAVLDRFAVASKILTDVLNMLEPQALFSVEPLQIMFDLVIFNFTAEEVLREKETRNEWDPILNRVVESAAEKTEMQGQ